MRDSMCHPSGVFLRRITRKRGGSGHRQDARQRHLEAAWGLPAKTSWIGAGCWQGPNGSHGGNMQGSDGAHVGNAQGLRDSRTVELRSACKVAALGWRRRDRPGATDEEGGRRGSVAHAAAHSQGKRCCRGSAPSAPPLPLRPRAPQARCGRRGEGPCGSGACRTRARRPSQSSPRAHRGMRGDARRVRARTRAGSSPVGRGP